VDKQPEAITQSENEAARIRLLPGSDLFDRIQELSNSVARRAFEIFENRGRALGRDLEDWLRAERPSTEIPTPSAGVNAER